MCGRVVHALYYNKHRCIEFADINSNNITVKTDNSENKIDIDRQRIKKT